MTPQSTPRSPKPPPLSAAPAAGTRWRPPLLEDDFQATVIELLLRRGFLVHHSRPAVSAGRHRTALQGVPGCPDLVIAKRFIWLVELKRDAEKPTAAQQCWQDAGGELCAVWRPRDLPWIQDWARDPFQAVTG